MLIEVKRTAEERWQEIQPSIDPRKPCAICGGKMAKPGSISAKQHDKNRDVWPVEDPDGKGCGNMLRFAVVCTHCWAAPPIGGTTWMQSSEHLEAFVIPLLPSIAKAPRPSVAGRELPWIFETFQRPGKKRTERAWFGWIEQSPDNIVALREYAGTHGLQFEEQTTLPLPSITLSTPEEVPPEDGTIPGL